MTTDPETPTATRRETSAPASWLRRFTRLTYAITGLVSLLFGGIYLTSSTFLPYHADALGVQWETLEPATQVLLRALIHVAGAGWVACGIALFALAWIPLRHGARWAKVIAPAVGLAFWVPTLWASLEVTSATPATAPWYGSVVAIVMLLAAAAASALEETR